jgi:hypothetical protein
MGPYERRSGAMSVEQRGPAVCSLSGRQEGKDEMTKASVNLQDLRRRIYVKAKAETEKRSKRIAKTVAELCDLYLADAKAGRLLTRRVQKKASTLAIDTGRIERHIKPLLGRRSVSEVARDDVEAFMQDVTAGKTAGRAKSGKKRGLARVRGGKGAANRAVGLLGAIFTCAVRARLRSDNPAHGVMRPPDGKRDRRLTEDEYLHLGRALKAARAAGV